MIVPVARPYRTRINRALHELRRPLQLLALRGEGSDELDAICAALDEIDEIVNGSRTAPRPSGESERLRVLAAIQNIVVNALEHGAGSVEISASPAAGTIVVRNRIDRDRNGDADPRKGHGLEIIADAARAAGGQFSFSQDRGEAVAVLALGPSDQAAMQR